jgi:hypothetical protein
MYIRLRVWTQLDNIIYTEQLRYVRNQNFPNYFELAERPVDVLFDDSGFWGVTLRSGVKKIAIFR